MRLSINAGIALAAAALGKAWLAMQCRHRQEMFDRYADGRPALRCSRCLRLRPNPLGVPRAAFHLTQPGGPITASANGIARYWAALDEPITDEALFDILPGRVNWQRRPTDDEPAAHAAAGANDHTVTVFPGRAAARC